MFIILLSFVYVSIAFAVKHPILLVPGFGGSQLEQKETAPTILAKYEFCCSTQFDWTRTWVVVTQIVPYAWECFAQRVSRNFINDTWYDKPNVFTRNIEGLDAIGYLDPSNFITRRETIYFANLISALQSFGYNNSNLMAAPYDWRLLPFEQKELFDFMKTSIEKMIIVSGGSGGGSGGRAIVITHSMGGPYFHYFLTNIVDNAWKNKYIEKWISVASPFIGSPKGIQAVLSGYNFGIPIVTNAEGLEIGPYIGASYYLMPRESDKWQNVVTTKKGLSFNSSQLASLLNYANVTMGPDKFKVSTRDWTNRVPNVNVVLVSGVNISTDYAYVYDETSFSSGPVTVKYGSGDGTVPEISAFYPVNSGWNITEIKKFNGLDHVGILANGKFIDWCLQEINVNL